jgi:hypothetical protein
MEQRRKEARHSHRLGGAFASSKARRHPDRAFTSFANFQK